jgi:hypothetical protein
MEHDSQGGVLIRIPCSGGGRLIPIKRINGARINRGNEVWINDQWLFTAPDDWLGLALTEVPTILYMIADPPQVFWNTPYNPTVPLAFQFDEPQPEQSVPPDCSLQHALMAMCDNLAVCFHNPTQEGTRSPVLETRSGLFNNDMIAKAAQTAKGSIWSKDGNKTFKKLVAASIRFNHSIRHEIVFNTDEMALASKLDADHQSVINLGRAVIAAGLAHLRLMTGLVFLNNCCIRRRGLPCVVIGNTIVLTEHNEVKLLQLRSWVTDRKNGAMYKLQKVFAIERPPTISFINPNFGQLPDLTMLEGFLKIPAILKSTSWYKAKLEQLKSGRYSMTVNQDQAMRYLQFGDVIIVGNDFRIGIGKSVNVGVKRKILTTNPDETDDLGSMSDLKDMEPKLGRSRRRVAISRKLFGQNRITAPQPKSKTIFSL